MPTTRQFDRANDYLRTNLGYQLDVDKSFDFRMMLQKCGFTRFTHAVEIVRLQPLLTNAVDRHNRLLIVMRELLPKVKRTALALDKAQ